MSLLRAPFISNAFRGQGDALTGCIDAVARRYAFSQPDVAITMSFFLEAVAVEMDRGNSVTIRGFGTFKPTTYHPRKKKLPPYCRPYFYPASKLKRAVQMHAIPSKAVIEAVTRYRERHRPGKRSDKASQRTFTAMEAWRQQVEAHCPGLRCDAVV